MTISHTNQAGLLVFNGGSSSIKFALFDDRLERSLSGVASEIGGKGQLTIDEETTEVDFADPPAALDAILQALRDRGLRLEGLAGVAHRVVHGGADLTAPVRLTPKTIAAIEACVPLAPLHNPENLALIEAVAKAVPGLPQFASFDTAFHQSNPELAVRYAVPRPVHDEGIRRYGFHGISYAGLGHHLPEISGQPLPERLLAIHLGNGASLCAMRGGRSVATTMGYSPLDGLTMGTRSGGIDGNAVLRLAREHGIEGAEHILNNESGLLGLAGLTDMRKLHAAGTPEAGFAVDHFCYWAVRHAGSMIAAMAGLDALAFTGGIGEHDSHVRAAIMRGLAWLGLAFDETANAGHRPRLHADGSAVEAWIVPADEERTIARDAFALTAGEEGAPPASSPPR